MLGKEESEACVWSKEGRTGIWSAFHSFSLFFLHLMQFGSLRSHIYMLTLCFKLINFTEKRPMFYERSMSHSSYFQLPPNSTCAKANLFSGFFSPVRTLPSASFPRDRPPEHMQHILPHLLSVALWDMQIGESRIKRFSFFCLWSFKWTTLTALCDRNCSQLTVCWVKFVWN